MARARFEKQRHPSTSFFWKDEKNLSPKRRVISSECACELFIAHEVIDGSRLLQVVELRETSLQRRERHQCSVGLSSPRTGWTPSALNRSANRGDRVRRHLS